HQTIQRQINVQVQGSAGSAIANADARVVEQVMLLKVAHARRRAVELADHGKFSEASQVLEAVIEEIDGAAVSDVPLLQDEEKSLAKQASDLKLTGANPPISGAGTGGPTDYVNMR